MFRQTITAVEKIDFDAVGKFRLRRAEYDDGRFRLPAFFEKRAERLFSGQSPDCADDQTVYSASKQVFNTSSVSGAPFLFIVLRKRSCQQAVAVPLRADAQFLAELHADRIVHFGYGDSDGRGFLKYQASRIQVWAVSQGCRGFLDSLPCFEPDIRFVLQSPRDGVHGNPDQIRNIFQCNDGHCFLLFFRFVD